MLATRRGNSIRFEETQLRRQGRATRGVRGVRLRKDDLVNSLEIVSDEATYLVCTENGYGKRTSFEEHRLQGRGGSGIIAIRTSERNGEVVAAHAVREDESLMLITAQGKMIRMNIADISVIGRATQGVRLINLDKDDRLVSATRVDHADEEPDQENGGEDGEITAGTEPPVDPGIPAVDTPDHEPAENPESSEA